MKVKPAAAAAAAGDEHQEDDDPAGDEDEGLQVGGAVAVLLTADAPLVHLAVEVACLGKGREKGVVYQKKRKEKESNSKLGFTGQTQ